MLGRTEALDPTYVTLNTAHDPAYHLFDVLFSIPRHASMDVLSDLDAIILHLNLSALP
jgi:hypothetical protein